MACTIFKSKSVGRFYRILALKRQCILALKGIILFQIFTADFKGIIFVANVFIRVCIEIQSFQTFRLLSVK